MSIIHHSVEQSVDYKTWEIGGQSVQLPTQVLEDQLTLYQPEGQIVPPHYYLPTQL